jgi:hypothetical protein
MHATDSLGCSICSMMFERVEAASSTAACTHAVQTCYAAAAAAVGAATHMTGEMHVAELLGVMDMPKVSSKLIGVIVYSSDTAALLHAHESTASSTFSSREGDGRTLSEQAMACSLFLPPIQLKLCRLASSPGLLCSSPQQSTWT